MKEVTSGDIKITAKSTFKIYGISIVYKNPIVTGPPVRWAP